ncbi:MAG: 5'-deoxynucleotidase [Lachnospiraceae bacterium]|nr:5'-deoxynucleotidase [Lachnospiraceae bacterium]
MKNNFYAMLSRMKYINRWGLMRNTIHENISEHSLDTAIIAHALATISNVYFKGNINAERVALLALFHDCTEIITGDMPTPVKYHAPEIREAYKEVELVAKDRLISGLPEEMRGIYDSLLVESEDEKQLWRYVKAADKLSALIKCVEEKRMGNDDFIKAESSTLDSLKKMKMPEVDMFLKDFMPAYNLTLDEQA